MYDVLGPIPAARAAATETEDGLVVLRAALCATAPDCGDMAEEDGPRIEIAGTDHGIDIIPLLRPAMDAGHISKAGLRCGGDLDVVYAEACRAAERGDAARAARSFLHLVLTEHRTGSALHGLAAVLCRAGRHDEALKLALIVASSGHPDPRALILAGYAAYRTGDSNLGRRCLAKASRQARGRPEYAEELRFAQRLLLTQQFEE